MTDGQVRRARGATAAPGEPCGRCGVRADVGCKHSPAAGVAPLAIATANDPPRKDGRNKPNFNSLWGKAGNPTARQFARNLEAARKALGEGSPDDQRG